MAKKILKKIVNKVKKVVIPKPKKVLEAPDSPEKAAFRDFMAQYELRNPEKFAQKKEELLEHLNTL